VYDPGVGRWYGEDMLGFAAGDANLSRYVGNDPGNKVDPSGYLTGGVLVAGTVAAAIGNKPESPVFVPAKLPLEQPGLPRWMLYYSGPPLEFGTLNAQGTFDLHGFRGGYLPPWVASRVLTLFEFYDRVYVRGIGVMEGEPKPSDRVLVIDYTEFWERYHQTGAFVRAPSGQNVMGAPPPRHVQLQRDQDRQKAEELRLYNENLAELRAWARENWLFLPGGGRQNLMPVTRLGGLSLSASSGGPRTITPYRDPARPGYNNGATHIDHAQARSLGGTNDSSNLRPLAGETNLRKGGHERALRAYEQYLIRNGMSPRDARAVIQAEIDAMIVSPPPRPMDPKVLDQLPANPLDQGCTR
jgi:hypothetical protein